MTILLAILLVGVIYGAYRLADDYVSRSINSFASADRMWSNLVESAHKLLDDDIPPSVARIVLGLVAIAGCGCFVRGMLLSYYLPIPKGMRSKPDQEWDKSFSAIDQLSSEQRDQFNQLLSLVLVYDSFRNPFQGWLFRRALNSYLRNEQTFAQRATTQITVMSVLSGNATKIKSLVNNPLAS